MQLELIHVTDEICWWFIFFHWVWAMSMSFHWVWSESLN